MLKICTQEEIKKVKKRFPRWEINAHSMQRTWEFEKFSQAMAFIVQVGFCAEHVQHHPRITNSYCLVQIQLTTHDVGNQLTQLDVKLAELIECIVIASEEG